MYARVLGMIDAMLYAQIYASVCVSVSLECNVKHAFNEIKI